MKSLLICGLLAVLARAQNITTVAGVEGNPQPQPPGTTPLTTGLVQPQAVVWDAAGNLYIADGALFVGPTSSDYINDCVVWKASGNTMTVFAGVQATCTSPDFTSTPPQGVTSATSQILPWLPNPAPPTQEEPAPPSSAGALAICGPYTYIGLANPLQWNTGVLCTPGQPCPPGGTYNGTVPRYQFYPVLQLDSAGKVTYLEITGPGVPGYQYFDPPAMFVQQLACDSQNNVYAQSAFLQFDAGLQTSIDWVPADGSPSLNIYYGFDSLMHGVAIDPTGNIYTVEGKPGFNEFVTQLLPPTSPGGPYQPTAIATSEMLLNGYNLVSDGGSKLFITQPNPETSPPQTQGQDIIGFNLAKGQFTTIAGTPGTAGWNGNNVPALEAELNNPQGIFTDGKGHVVFADTGNYIVREFSLLGYLNFTANGSYAQPFVFPAAAVNGGTELLVTVKNMGATPVTGQNIASITAPFEIGTGGTCALSNFSLAKGASCTINLLFKPTSAGSDQTGTLTLSDSAPDSPQEISLLGSTAATNPTYLELSANGSSTQPFVFPAAAVNGSGSLTIAVQNVGSVRVTGKNIASVVGPFSLTSGGTCDLGNFSIAAGTACTINMLFKPVSAGANQSGTLTLSDSAADTPQIASLLGSANGVGLSTQVDAKLSPKSTVPYGTAVSLTVDLLPASGPTGIIDYTVETTKATVVSGTMSPPGGTVQLPTLAAGSYTIAVDYQGDSKYAGSKWQSSLVVTTISTTTTLTISPNPTYFGQPVTFTAEVTPAPANGDTVQFLNGSTVLGAGTLTSGTATLTLTTLTAGSRNISAAFGGDPDYVASQSATVTDVVNPATPVIQWPTPAAIVYGTALSATQLDAAAKQSASGPAVSGTFVYTPAAGVVLNVPGGTLTTTFTPADTTDYTGATGSVNVTVTPAPLNVQMSNASAPYGAALPAFQYTYSGLVNGDALGKDLTLTVTTNPPAIEGSPAGKYTIGASLSGTAAGNYLLNLTTGTLTITPAVTSTVLTAATTTTAVNTPVMLTATVSSSTAGAPPNGDTVTFYSGSTALGTATLSGGVATFSATFTTAATDTLTAQYAGDPNYASSTSNAVTETVTTSGALVVTDLIPLNQSVGYQQMAINPATGELYLSGPACTTQVCDQQGVSVLSPVNDSITPLAAGTGNLAVDGTRNLIYVVSQGSLYQINGATNGVSYTGSSPYYNYDPLVAFDPGTNLIYAASYGNISVNVYQGANLTINPPQTAMYLTSIAIGEEYTDSLTVDSTHHIVYGVCAQYCGLSSNDSEGKLTINESTNTASLINLPALENILGPEFLPQSIAADGATGDLVVSGVTVPNYAEQTYQTYVYPPSGDTVGVSTVDFAPITTAMDSTNRVFYVGDANSGPYYGSSTPASHAAMVSGIDQLSFTATTMPIFSSSTTTTSNVYDIEPDTGAFTAYISGTSKEDGGFLKQWNGATSTVTGSVAIQGTNGAGGGLLAVNSSSHVVYLADNVNGMLWVINGPSPAPRPVLALSPSQINFGSSAVGTPQTMAVTVMNSGNAPLTVQSISSTSAVFTFPPTACSEPVAAGASCTFNVTFTPTTTGYAYGALFLATNAGVGPASLSMSGTGQIDNPLPVNSSIAPSSATAGGAGFTLTVNGSGFVGSSTVEWNGSARTTTLVNAGQITAAITSADIATAGTATVTVVNPPPGGGTSGPVTFTILNPVPSAGSLSPSSTAVGGAAFSLTLYGSNFVASSAVLWNGSARSTTFVSTKQIKAAITAADIATAGSASVTVSTPTPGGGTSAALTFTVSSPRITSLSPSSQTAGGPAFSLTVNGADFLAGSQVQWNGSNRTTSYVSGTQLTAAITAADIATAGVSSVTVTNPGTTSGGISNSYSFVVDNPVPTLTSLSPPSGLAGGGAFTLTLTGTNFVANSLAKWNGTAQATTYVSSTQLTAQIYSSAIASAGTAQVTVTNPGPGGGTSGVVDFPITNPAPAISKLQPASAQAGGAAFTLTIDGSGFDNSSVAMWNGSPRITTYRSSSSIQASITAADIATAGTAQVTVENPTPGGGTSAPVAFTIK